MKFCSECGGALENGVCTQCGRICEIVPVTESSVVSAAEPAPVTVAPAAAAPVYNVAVYGKKPKFCRRCGTMVPKRAKRCAACGKRVKKPIYRRFLFWVFIALIVVVVLASASGKKSSSRSSSNASYSSSDSYKPSTSTATRTSEPTVKPAEEEEKPAEESADEPEPGEEKDDDTISPELIEFLDSYEAFMDDYIAFMQKFNASDGTDFSLLLEYTSMLADYADFADKADAWEDEDMNNAELKYYTEVMLRVDQKLINAAIDMS